jgi:hypothetical protein
MKLILAIALLFAATRITTAQDSSCATLYDHGNRDIILCRIGSEENGTARYTRTYTGGDSVSTEHITFEQYIKMMEEDTKALQEQTAQLDAVYGPSAKQGAGDEEGSANRITRQFQDEQHAAALHHKKECRAAGFFWQSGICWARRY